MEDFYYHLLSFVSTTFYVGKYGVRNDVYKKKVLICNQHGQIEDFGTGVPTELEMMQAIGKHLDEVPHQELTDLKENA